MGILISQMPAPQQVRPKGIADIVICIDCTESMSPCIAGVKENVQKLVAAFAASKEVRLDWRVRLIEYRDLNIDEPIHAYDFTTCIDQFRGQVEALKAIGGGDEPESTLDAIMVGLRSPWRHPCNKCIVVFTDATPHPLLHPSTVEPRQPRTVEGLIQEVLHSHARLFLYGPDCSVYRQLAQVEYIEFNPVGLKDWAKAVDFARILDTIGSTVTASTTPLFALPPDLADV